MTYAPGDTLRIPVTGDTLTGLDGATDPYGLYRDGTRDAAVTVTVTGSGNDWLAALTIPTGYSLGDTVWLKLLATTADGTYVVTSEPIVLADPQAAAAAAIADAGLATDTTAAAIKAKTDLIPADPATVTKQDEILADLAALDWRTQAILSGTVNTVTSNADFTITGDFGSVDDSYCQCYIQFTSGSNKGIGRLIGAYTGSTKRVQFNGGGIARGAFPYTVIAGDEFILVPTSDLVVGIVGVKAN
jgi:hypothetical protein